MGLQQALLSIFTGFFLFGLVITGFWAVYQIRIRHTKITLKDWVDSGAGAVSICSGAVLLLGICIKLSIIIFEHVK